MPRAEALGYGCPRLWKPWVMEGLDNGNGCSDIKIPVNGNW